MINRRNRLPFQALALPALAWGLCSAWCGAAWGLEYVTFQRDGRTISVEGQVLQTALDGGILVQGRDGMIWAVQQTPETPTPLLPTAANILDAMVPCADPPSHPGPPPPGSARSAKKSYPLMSST